MITRLYPKKQSTPPVLTASSVFTKTSLVYIQHRVQTIAAEEV